MNGDKLPHDLEAFYDRVEDEHAESKDAERRRVAAELRMRLEKEKRLEPDVVLYGKKGCRLCKSAAQKLDRLRVPYIKRDMADVVSGLVRDSAALAEYCMQDEKIPIITIKGRGYSYPAAMKELRGRKGEALPKGMGPQDKKPKGTK